MVLPVPIEQWWYLTHTIPHGLCEAPPEYKSFFVKLINTQMLSIYFPTLSENSHISHHKRKTKPSGTSKLANRLGRGREKIVTKETT
jgi:hypothetical protein